MEVSVMVFHQQLSMQPMHPSLVLEGQSRVYHSRCVLVSSISLSVLACLAKCGHCEVFKKWNGFGDDVIAEQPSHTCLHVHNTVCHVTPCVLPSSE